MAADAREKLAGILRIETSKLETDINRANQLLSYIGRDSRISSQIRDTISKALLQGVKDGIKEANALGLELKVKLKGGSTGGGHSGGSQQHVLGNQTIRDIIGQNGTTTSRTTSYDGQGNEIVKTLTAINQAGQQVRATLDDLGYVASYSIKNISTNAKDSKDTLEALRKNVTDLKAAYQEWFDLAKNPSSSAFALEDAQAKVEALTSDFQDLKVLSDVYKEMGLDVAAFTKQVESGERVIETFSGKMQEAFNTSAAKQLSSEAEQLTQKYSEQARLIQEVADAEIHVKTSSGEQKQVAQELLDTRNRELTQIEQEIDAIRNGNAALKNSKADLEGQQKVRQAIQIAAEKTAAADAKNADQTKDQAKQRYLQSLNQEKQILENIHSLEKNLVTARGSEKANIENALTYERQRLSDVQKVAQAIAQRLNLSPKETQALREQVGLESQRLKHEIELGELRRKNSLSGKFQDAFENIPSMMTNSLVNGMTMAITQIPIQTLKQFWSDAWNYATQYYDRMNEIRIVTLKTQDDADKLSDNFRRIAQEMSVSSNEIAEAAMIFYRQGLDDGEVEQRMQATIQYAKTAGVASEDAANKITAVVNSINKDARGVEMTAQRVADVFLYLGKRHCPIAV